ncbi:hypothetical protein GCM10029964_086340 [Kibdelosporangium lantanae]
MADNVPSSSSTNVAVATTEPDASVNRSRTVQSIVYSSFPSAASHGAREEPARHRAGRPDFVVDGP